MITIAHSNRQIDNIKTLKEVALELNIRHFRYHVEDVRNAKTQKERRSLTLIPSSQLEGKNIWARGGETVIEAVIDCQKYVGQTLCSLQDNFNKKRGVKIAIQRLTLV